MEENPTAPNEVLDHSAEMPGSDTAVAVTGEHSTQVEHSPAAEHHVQEEFYHVPTFWVAIAFVVFVSLAWKPLVRFLTHALDARAARIDKDLRDAIALREEAQSLLAEYQKKQRENLEEAKRIVEQTKADAKAMADKAEQDLRDTLEKRKALAMEKIAQAEREAVRMVQQNVVDIALSASREIISKNSNAEGMIDSALDDINQKLH